MSTRINGYKTDLDIKKVYKILIEKLKPAAVDLARKKTARNFAAKIANQFDDIALGRIEARDNKTAADIATQIFLEDIEDRRSRKPYEQPYIFLSIFLYPEENRTLMIPASNENELIDLFDQIRKIKEYKWYDNTDRPDNVTAKEWSAREREWKKHMGQSWIISDRGMELKLVKESDLDVEADLIWGSLPSIEDRIFTQARMLFFKERYDQSKGIGQILGLGSLFVESKEDRARYEAQVRDFIIPIDKTTPVGKIIGNKI